MDATDATPMTDADAASPPADASFEAAEPLKDEGVGFTPDKPAEPAPRNFTEQASEKARFFAGQGKDKATDALVQLSQMLTDAAGQVDDKLGSQYGEYARTAAGQVQGFADTLGNKNVDELLEDARDLVRKSPGVAIGAAAALGFVVARLLSAGLEQRDA